MAQSEEWRDIPGYEGRYQVSDLGRVSGKKGTILKAQKINSGYLVVHLCANGIRRIGLVHRLVAETYLPNPARKETVNHTHPDGDKTRNTLLNLEWATRAENMAHARANGLCPLHPTKRFAVVGSPAAGGVPVRFDSQIAAEVALAGKASSAVHHCLVGKKKSAYGYYWSRV